VRLDAGTGYGLRPGADDDGRVADDAAVAAVGNPYESRKLRVFLRLGTDALALRLCDRASAEAATPTAVEPVGEKGDAATPAIESESAVECGITS
jgi:hypothetical protein